MNAPELMAELRQRGVVLKTTPIGGLRYHPKGAVTPELLAELKERKPELMKLLEPTRTTEPPDSHGDSLQSCPDHWKHIPVLPAKGETVTPTDEHGNGARYRVCLFERWYILRFAPNVSETHVEATSDDGKRYSLPSMDSLYRALWAEAYVPGLSYKETN